MNARNLICWVIVIVAYVLLSAWGHSSPITMERGARSMWTRFSRKVVETPLPGRPPRRPPPQRPAIPPPPTSLSHEQAKEIIASSVFTRRADKLFPHLCRSIRVSPLPVETLDDIKPGASRLYAAPDVPPGFEWPQYQGTPLTPLAQIQLGDVTALDDNSRLPPTGWLYFFFATAAKPPVPGTQPEHRQAWKVIYADGDAGLLKRTGWPKGVKEECPPCRLRFWGEWTMPSLAEEPDLLEGDENSYLYDDLCGALSARPNEPGWHHLLGYPQSYAGSLRTVCALVSGGVAISREMIPGDPKARSLAAGAREWVLLFQLDMSGLAELDLIWNAPQAAQFGDYHDYYPGDLIYFYVRSGDLANRDFSNVWALRPAAFVGEEDEEEEPDVDEEAPTDEGD